MIVNSVTRDSELLKRGVASCMYKNVLWLIVVLTLLMFICEIKMRKIILLSVWSITHTQQLA